MENKKCISYGLEHEAGVIISRCYPEYRDCQRICQGRRSAAISAVNVRQGVS